MRLLLIGRLPHFATHMRTVQRAGQKGKARLGGLGLAFASGVFAARGRLAAQHTEARADVHAPIRRLAYHWNRFADALARWAPLLNMSGLECMLACIESDASAANVTFRKFNPTYPSIYSGPLLRWPCLGGRLRFRVLDLTLRMHGGASQSPNSMAQGWRLS